VKDSESGGSLGVIELQMSHLLLNWKSHNTDDKYWPKFDFKWYPCGTQKHKARLRWGGFYRI